MLYETTIQTPIGQLTAVASDTGLRELRLPLPDAAPRPRATPAPDHPVLVQTRRELDEYFRGQRRSFDVPLDQVGSTFQKTVWDALMAIPYGATASYGEVADRIGKPGAARAVGGANGRNPIPIVVPCHRVIGASGALTGYGGPGEAGLVMKRWLIRHENPSHDPNTAA